MRVFDKNFVSRKGRPDVDVVRVGSRIHLFLELEERRARVMQHNCVCYSENDRASCCQPSVLSTRICRRKLKNPALRPPRPIMIGFYILFLLCFGSLNTLTTKWQFSMESVGLDGIPKNFQKPW